MSDAAAAPARPPRFGMLWYWIALLLIALEAVFPIFLLVIGATIASQHGCTINEGNTTPCLIDGTDWGETLQFLGLSPLFMIATFPIALVLFGLWLLILLLHRASWRRRHGIP